MTVRIDDDSFSVDRETAQRLQSAIGDALTERHEFFRTTGEHRADGSYEVSRRGADSAGNSKVFESFGAARRLYSRLPGEFGAEEVSRAGVTGSRRHMLVRHFAEHPGFDCELTSRNPLTARKHDSGAATAQAGGRDLGRSVMGESGAD